MVEIDAGGYRKYSDEDADRDFRKLVLEKVYGGTDPLEPPVDAEDEDGNLGDADGGTRQPIPTTRSVDALFAGAIRDGLTKSEGKF
jgi:hypothetical protein